MFHNYSLLIDYCVKTHIQNAAPQAKTIAAFGGFNFEGVWGREVFATQKPNASTEMQPTNYLTLHSSRMATMQTSTLSLSTLTGSTIRASFLTLSTLIVSSINGALPGTGTGTGTGAFSTLAVSSLQTASTITASSIIVTTGNVGIGTAAPGYTLHVQGAIYASGNITALSDQRHKQNIIRLDHSLDAIRSLSGYYYTRDDYQPGIRQIGLLAQEVNKVIPEAVSYDSTNDTYSLNYGCLMAPVIESIKELSDRVEAQQSVIDAQQSVIDAQQVVIKKLLDRLGPE